LGGTGGKQFAELTRPILTGTQKPLLQQGKELVGEIGTSALGEIGGHLIGKLGSAVTGFLRPQVAAGAPGVQRQMQEFGSSLSPAQATDSRFWDFMENIAEASFFGGGKLAKLKLSQNTALKGLAERFIRRVGTVGGDEALASLYKESLKGETRAWQAGARTLYREVDQLAGGAVVPTEPVVGFVKEALKRKSFNVEKALSAAGVDDWGKFLVQRTPGTPASVILGPTGQPISQGVPGKQIAQTSLELATEMRSRLLRVGRRTPKSSEDVGIINTAKHLAGLMDDAIKTAEGNLSPEALRALGVANQFYRTGAERLRNEIVVHFSRGVAKEAGKVVRTLLQPGNIELARKVKASVTPQVAEMIERTALTSMVLKAEHPSLHIVSGDTLFRQIHSLGDETLQSILGPARLAQLKEFAETFALVQKPRPGNVPGGVFMQLSQAPAAFELVTGGLGAMAGKAGKGIRALSATIIVGPMMIGRILANPKLTDTLIRGARAGAGTETLTRAIAQITAHVGQGTVQRMGQQANFPSHENPTMRALRERYDKTQ